MTAPRRSGSSADRRSPRRSTDRRGGRSRSTVRERREPSVRTTTTEPTGRGSADRERARSLRRKVFLLSGVAVTIVAVLFAVLWFSPLMSVRKIEFVGDGVLTEEELLPVLGIAEGTPLLQIDTGAAARRIAGNPRVAEARVQRNYPSTVRLTVTERIPVAFFDSPQGTHLLDSDGVDFAIEPPPFGTVRLVTPAPGSEDPATTAALGVLEALPPLVRGQVAEVAAPTISSVSVRLMDGRVVVWGGVDNSTRKSAVVSALLTQPGQTFDVSSPELPTVK
ncbi:FtsQ-type POTRA domain-containing protein [Rhodococcus sp. ABRD24]|nr:FtsQ-type POTRA domain-containing protein [Rhodococcus sp. ABRD24]